DRRPQLHAHQHRRRRARRGQPARWPRLVHRRPRRGAVPERDHQHPAVPRLERLVRPDHGRAADAGGAVLLPGARADPPGEDVDRQHAPGARRLRGTLRDGRRGSVMDALERLVAIQEISDLIGRYCMCFDDEDWAGLHELWTDDAAFVVEDQAFEGREVLMEFLSTCLPKGYRSKHMIARPLVELAPSGDRATARTDVVWIAANFENTIVGRYEDELVRDERGWRFKRRVERPVQYIPGPPPMSDAATGVS